jgi:hypothetical protein
MRLEEFDKLRLVLSAYALKIQDLFEVGIGSISDMDQVSLYETFWGD